MAPVPGRSAARGTWHVPPRKGLPEISRAPTGQTGGTTELQHAGHDTPIKFHECNSMANDTDGGVHRARAHVQPGKAPLP